MPDSTFHPTSEQLHRVATLYHKDDQGNLVAAQRSFARGRPGDPPSPSGGLFSTAGDMFRFYQMILGGGEIDGDGFGQLDHRALGRDIGRPLRHHQVGTGSV